MLPRGTIMIEDELDLIERLVQKTKKYGICWACTKRFECRNKTETPKEDFEFANGCISFNERDFLDSYNL